MQKSGDPSCTMSCAHGDSLVFSGCYHAVRVSNMPLEVNRPVAFMMFCGFHGFIHVNASHPPPQSPTTQTILNCLDLPEAFA